MSEGEGKPEMSQAEALAAALSGRFLAQMRKGDAFTCPRCGAYAHQTWGLVLFHARRRSGGLQLANYEQVRLDGSKCAHCDQVSFWEGDKCVVPANAAAVEPDPEMPRAVREVFDEARLVFAHSPRAAAALLRLSLEILLEQLGYEGRDLNEKIGAAVRAGNLGPTQKAADVVRLIGNRGIHPGEIDFDEQAATTEKLFLLVNYVVQKLISEPRKLEQLYRKVSPGTLNQIAQRDGAVSTKSED